MWYRYSEAGQKIDSEGSLSRFAQLKLELIATGTYQLLNFHKNVVQNSQHFSQGSKPVIDIWRQDDEGAGRGRAGPGVHRGWADPAVAVRVGGGLPRPGDRLEAGPVPLQLPLRLRAQWQHGVWPATRASPQVWSHRVITPRGAKPCRLL